MTDPFINMFKSSEKQYVNTHLVDGSATLRSKELQYGNFSLHTMSQHLPKKQGYAGTFQSF